MRTAFVCLLASGKADVAKTTGRKSVKQFWGARKRLQQRDEFRRTRPASIDGRRLLGGSPPRCTPFRPGFMRHAAAGGLRRSILDPPMSHRPARASGGATSLPTTSSSSVLRPVSGALAASCRQAGQPESVSTIQSDREEENVERGSGELVTGEGAPARRSRRRRLFELVCAHGPGSDRGGHRAPVGADPLPQELDPIALCRAGAGLLAGGTDASRPHRADRALGGAALGRRQAEGRAGEPPAATAAACQRQRQRPAAAGRRRNRARGARRLAARRRG